MRYFRVTFASALIGIAATGSAQSRFQAAAPPVGPVRTPAQCLGLTMHLEPGARRPDGSRWPGWVIARDMPLDGVAAQAPLYPGAVVSHAPLAKNIFIAVTASSYLKTAVAEFSVPSSTGPALGWYRKSFAACGFRIWATSTKAVVFASPTTASLHVSVSLQRVSPESSLVLYYASAESVPARPSRSLVGSGVTTAAISYRPPSTSKSIHMKLANPSLVHMLVYTVDLPTEVVTSVNSCSMDQRGANATVVFDTSRGRRTRMVVDPDCYDFTVNGSRFIWDDNRGVWSFISFLVYKHCLQKQCTLLK